MTDVEDGFFASGTAVDARGNLFVADSSVSAVFEIVAVKGAVSSTSKINVIGSGFSAPAGVAVDTKGDVFVADTGNNAVKEIVAVSGKVSSSSTVNVIGSGFSSPSGVAVDSNGNVFVADTGNNAVKEIVAVSGKVSSSSTVTSIGSGFSAPAGVAVDSANNVIIADTGNNALKEYWPWAPAQFTIASGFSQLSAVAVDATGDVFVADSGDGEVKEVVLDAGIGIPANPVILTVGSGFSSPASVAADNGGDVFVGDMGNLSIHQVNLEVVGFGQANLRTTSGPILIPFNFDSPTTISGWKVYTQGVQGLDFVKAPSGSSCRAGTYSAGDTCVVAVNFHPTRPGMRMGAVQMIDSGGVVASVHLGGIGVGPHIVFPPKVEPGITLATGSQAFQGLNLFWGFTVDPAGDLIYADGTTVKEMVAVNGEVTLSSPIQTIATLTIYPFSMALDGAGNLFVAGGSGGYGLQEIVAVNGQLSASSPVVNIYPGDFNYGSIAIDAAGNLYVAFRPLGTKPGGTVSRFNAVNGQISTNAPVVVSNQFSSPEALAFDAAGDLFVTDYGLKEIVAENGHIATPSPVSSVTGEIAALNLAVDAAGDVFFTGRELPDRTEAVNEIVAVNGQVSSTSPIVTVSQPTDRQAGAQALAIDPRGNLFASYYRLAEEDGEGIAIRSWMTKIPFSAQPPILFPATHEGISTGPQSLHIANNGNAPLTFPSPSAGMNPAITGNFTWDDTSTCSQTTASATSPFTLAPGSPCTIALNSVPTTNGGSYSGTLVLTDDTLNAPAPAYASQTINLDGNATGVVVGAIGTAVDATTNSISVYTGDNLLVTGWAAAPFDGSPVSQVAVLINGTPAGNATLGFLRPDIAAAKNDASYVQSGWRFIWSAASLNPGTLYTVTAVATDAQGITATLGPKTFYTSSGPVWGAPQGSLGSATDATTRATTVAQADSLLVTGWAADDHDGAPVTSVGILIDGTLAGNATLGIARPDVVAVTGHSGWLSSGWTFTTPASSLAVGIHSVSAIATDSLGSSATFGPKSVAVATNPVDGPPFGSIGMPADGPLGSITISQSGSLLISGWAADYHDGAPVSSVSIQIDGIAVGNATLGLPRPDVAKAEKNPADLHAGWTFTLSASGLSVGPHAVTAVATDSLGLSQQVGIRSITVTP